MATAVRTRPAREPAETVTLGGTTAPRYMTVAQFERFPWSDDVVPELVRGEVQLSPLPAAVHGWIVRNLTRALDAYARPLGLGEVFGDGMGYRLRPLTLTVRGPDVSFVRTGRLPASVPTRGYFEVAPDLAVEVLSPSNRRARMEQRISDLFATGTAAVWVVDPRTRAVTVRTPDGGARVLGEADTLDGAPVLPEFTMPVADVFAGVAPPPLRRRRAP